MKTASPVLMSALVAALAVGSAGHAQPASGGTVSHTSAGHAANAVASGGTNRPSAAAVASPGINPFTGRAQEFDALSTELEREQLRTKILEERSKQKNLEKNLETLPVRTRAEMRKIEQEMDNLMSGLERSAQSGPRVPTSSRGGPAPRAGLPSIAPVPAMPATVAEPVVPRTRLTAIVSDGKERVAIIEHGGGIHRVGARQTVAGVSVGEIFDDRAIVNGQELRVAIARVVSADRQPVATQPGGLVAAQSGTPASVGSAMPVTPRMPSAPLTSLLPPVSPQPQSR